MTSSSPIVRLIADLHVKHCRKLIASTNLTVIFDAMRSPIGCVCKRPKLTNLRQSSLLSFASNMSPEALVQEHSSKSQIKLDPDTVQKKKERETNRKALERATKISAHLNLGLCIVINLIKQSEVRVIPGGSRPKNI